MSESGLVSMVCILAFLFVVLVGVVMDDVFKALAESRPHRQEMAKMRLEHQHRMEEAQQKADNLTYAERYRVDNG